MKTTNFIKLVLFTLFICACSQEELSLDEYSLDKKEEKAIVKLLETNLTAATKSSIKIESTELKKIGDSYYLVSKHSNKTTTTLLKIENKNQLRYAGVSCTSSNCASSSTGCIPKPDGKACTKCDKFSGDCVKTVTSDQFTE